MIYIWTKKTRSTRRVPLIHRPREALGRARIHAQVQRGFNQLDFHDSEIVVGGGTIEVENAVSMISEAVSPGSVQGTQAELREENLRIRRFEVDD